MAREPRGRLLLPPRPGRCKSFAPGILSPSFGPKGPSQVGLARETPQRETGPGAHWPRSGLFPRGRRPVRNVGSRGLPRQGSPARARAAWWTPRLLRARGGAAAPTGQTWAPASAPGGPCSRAPGRIHCGCRGWRCRGTRSARPKPRGSSGLPSAWAPSRPWEPSRAQAPPRCPRTSQASLAFAAAAARAGSVAAAASALVSALSSASLIAAVSAVCLAGPRWGRLSSAVCAVDAPTRPHHSTAQGAVVWRVAGGCAGGGGGG